MLNEEKIRLMTELANSRDNLLGLTGLQWLERHGGADAMRLEALDQMFVQRAEHRIRVLVRLRPLRRGRAGRGVCLRKFLRERHEHDDDDARAGQDIVG